MTLVQFPMDTIFPSTENLECLRRKFSEGKFAADALTDEEMWLYRAYDYGFLWAREGDRSRRTLAIDPRGDWFDLGLAAKAEAYYCRRLGIQAADLGRRLEPTPEDIAHVEACVAKYRANLATYEARNRAAFAPEGRMDQGQINAALGVSATERKPSAYEDPDALRRGRVALGLENDLSEERG